MKRIAPIVLLLAAAALAQSPYVVSEYVFDEGGTDARTVSSGNYALRGSFHQTTIGRATPVAGGNLVAWIGYWHPRLTVIRRDVGVSRIISPPHTMGPGAVAPAAEVANYGRYPETFPVYFRILRQGDTLYRDLVSSVTLQPGARDTVQFSLAVLSDTGIYVDAAWTDLHGDENPLNDRAVDTTVVSDNDHDVGVVEIDRPTTWVRSQTVDPRAIIHNYGINTESFWTHFLILDTLGNLEYHDSVWVAGMKPDSNAFVTFRTWPARDAWHTAVCYTALATDLRPGNDTLERRFLVGVWGWFETTDVPFGHSDRQVRDGGCLAWVEPHYFYGLKGNRTTEFMRFNTTNGQWGLRESIPRPIWRYRSRPVKKGGALCYDGINSVYAVKGNNTCEFWHYSVARDSWMELESIPRGPKRKRLKYGSGLAYYPKGDSSFVWLLKGSNTNEFLGYWVEGDTWLYHADAPLGPRRKRYKYGSCIAADDRGHLYCLKARYNEFYRYDVSSDQWDTLAHLPMYTGGGWRRKLGPGAALCFAGGDTIYAFKGGNTWEFWRYDIARDSWVEELPIGGGPSHKRIKGGGALAWCPTQQRVYALKGNRTYEFWYYIPPPWWAPKTDEEPVRRPARSGVMADITAAPEGLRLLSPFVRGGDALIGIDLSGPARLDVIVTDVIGRVVRRQTGLRLQRGRHRLRVDCADLAPGVYLLMTELTEAGLDRRRSAHKLVKTR